MILADAAIFADDDDGDVVVIVVVVAQVQLPSTTRSSRQW